LAGLGESATHGVLTGALRTLSILRLGQAPVQPSADISSPSFFLLKKTQAGP
jgi:hypothetical protein